MPTPLPRNLTEILKYINTYCILLVSRLTSLFEPKAEKLHKPAEMRR